MGTPILRRVPFPLAWTVQFLPTLVAPQLSRWMSRRAADAWARVEADSVYFARSRTNRRRAQRMRLADQKQGKQRSKEAYRKVRDGHRP